MQKLMHIPDAAKTALAEFQECWPALLAELELLLQSADGFCEAVTSPAEP